MSVATRFAMEDIVRAEFIRPLGSRALVRRVERAEKTAGGIYLPDQARDLSQAGEILAIGDQVKEVKVGDRIIFSIYAAMPCIATTDNDDLVFIREQDIFALIV